MKVMYVCSNTSSTSAVHHTLSPLGTLSWCDAMLYSTADGTASKPLLHAMEYVLCKTLLYWSEIRMHARAHVESKNTGREREVDPSEPC